MRDARKSRYIPKDPFSHASSLLDTSDEDEVAGFSALVRGEAMLANIGDDRMMRLYQNDAIILTHLFQMAQQMPELRQMFATLYFGWKAELCLTRAKNGAERKLQAGVGTNYVPQETLIGYGGDFPQNPQASTWDQIKRMIPGKSSGNVQEPSGAWR